MVIRLSQLMISWLFYLKSILNIQLVSKPPNTSEKCIPSNNTYFVSKWGVDVQGMP